MGSSSSGRPATTSSNQAETKLVSGTLNLPGLSFSGVLALAVTGLPFVVLDHCIILLDQVSATLSTIKKSREMEQPQSTIEPASWVVTHRVDQARTSPSFDTPITDRPILHLLSSQEDNGS